MCVLLVVFLSGVVSLPSLPTSSIFSVVRRPSQPDIIHPSYCPSECEHLFSSLPANQTADGEHDSCSCQCPPNAPTYLHTAGYCIDHLDECPEAIEFSLGGSLPVVTLPAPGGLLFAQGELKWNATSVDRNTSDDFSCSISEMFVDSPIHRWSRFSSHHIFQLASRDGKPAVLFNGSVEEVAELQGVVVQLKVACEGEPRLLCIAFRVTGECEVPFVTVRGAPRMEMVLLVVISFVLLFLLFISLILYHICWRMKKAKLINEIQMQIMYHFKLGTNGGNSVASPTSAPPLHPRLSRNGSIPPSPDQSSIPNQLQAMPKRRLYFSAEYFDRELMLNPPAIAEQFLTDLRRMVDLAKDKIKLKRHIPHLFPIIEEDEMEVSEVVVHVPEETDPIPSRGSSEESPRSGKSFDSGRESINDSDESDESIEKEVLEDEEEEENGVKRIIEGFEQRVKKPASRIPVPPKSPKAAPARPMSLIPRLGQSSPRPLPRPLAIPPITDRPNPQSPTTKSPSNLPRRHDRRRGYAVFPIDPMLNKSLPRRPKREARAAEGS